MKPSPKCHTAGCISIEPILAAKPVGTYSIAGAQNKVVAEPKYALNCAGCGLQVVAHLENADFDEGIRSFTGGHFVADEPVHL